MTPRKYVICDIEATGLHEDKEIIEIALITFQDGKIVDVYETLINPLIGLSDYIKDLTSISQKELLAAPKFYDVAEAIRLRLEGSVFVSHNTDFDYQLLRKKYLEMGQEIKLKTFCTLKISQYEIPGLKSYSLDSLCLFFGIKIKERHRAIGDALATLELFKHLFELKSKAITRILFLPHHEKSLKKISTKSGLLYFKNARGKVIHFEAAFNMEKTARAMLQVKAENRDFLTEVDTVEGEVTGSPLIAEFKKLLYYPFKPKWMISIIALKSSEKQFRFLPFRKDSDAVWFFQHERDARKKLKQLEISLQGEKFIYRDGGKSKEEILRHNQKIDYLAREARFPTENLIILGEGRSLNEKSFILILGGHVVGYGYSDRSEAEIEARPEEYLVRRFFQHLGVNLTTMRYLRELKNMRQKTDGWRGLAEAR